MQHIAGETTVSLFAAGEHRNKMPFKGVLTYINRPSNDPPHGSGGKRVVLSAMAAEKALPSIVGMPVNYRADESGHDLTQVVGTIESAAIVGDAIEISGYVFAKNFPMQAKAIKKNKDALGFSWEIDVFSFEDENANPLVIQAAHFTGACIMDKTKAAYSHTSLAAAKGSLEMTEEQLKEILAAALKPMQDEIETLKKDPVAVAAASMLGKVEPHAARLEKAADAMEAAGIGGADPMGHASMARKMAADMRAQAAMGHMPAQFNRSMYAEGDTQRQSQTQEATAEMKTLKDEIASLSTQIKDLKAASANSNPPARKTEAGVGEKNFSTEGGGEELKVPSNVQSIMAQRGVGGLPLDDRGQVRVGEFHKQMEAAGVRKDQITAMKVDLERANYKFTR